MRTRPAVAATCAAILVALSAALLAGCASVGAGGAAEPATPATPQETARPAIAWPIKTRYHIDLWLHGYAMLQDDTTLVPYFKRGYREQMVALKNRANVVTDLDRNRDKLRARLAASQQLVGGQFIPLYFDTWDDMQRGINVFLQAGGDPRRASDAQTQAVIAIFAASFPTAADRDWLQTFSQALTDEGNRYYRSYWTQQQRERSAALTALDSLWTRRYLPKFRGFLNNTRQAQGDLFVSLPLDGEGRTLGGGGNRSNSMAVAYPESESTALDAIYVFAHEAAGTLANQVVNDNTTPAEKRTGAADRYASPAAVRGGALLLERIAPELVQGYQQYYLRSANARITPGLEATTLERTFPLPAPILDGIRRQLDVVLGGI
jgi:hypothetical protein